MEAFLSPLRAHQELRPGDRLIRDEPAVRFEQAQEICMIVFAVTDGESSEKDELLFLLPCSLLAPLVGKARQAVQQISPEELSRTLMEHVQQMPISITARLASRRSASKSFSNSAETTSCCWTSPSTSPSNYSWRTGSSFAGVPRGPAGDAPW